MNPLIFREYDIRGVADRDLDERAGRATSDAAFGTFLVAQAAAPHRARPRLSLELADRLHEALLDGPARGGPAT